MAGIDNLRPWKPGQSGNPGGYSKGRRLRNALIKLLDELGDDDMALAIYAKATGRKVLLKDEKEEDQRRSPEYIWWKELADQVDGPIEKTAATEPADDAKAQDDTGNPIEP